MEGKAAKVIENAEGARTTPSVVAFTGGESITAYYKVSRQVWTRVGLTIMSMTNIWGVPLVGEL